MKGKVDATVGRRVRALREGRGLSLDFLGRRMGVTGVHLGKMERGERRWSLDHLEAVALALEVPASWLLPWEFAGLSVQGLLKDERLFREAECILEEARFKRSVRRYKEDNG